MLDAESTRKDQGSVMIKTLGQYSVRNVRRYRKTCPSRGDTDYVGPFFLCSSSGFPLLLLPRSLSDPADAVILTHAVVLRLL